VKPSRLVDLECSCCIVFGGLVAAPVTSSEILVADYSKKLKDFGSSLRTSFFALFSAKSKIVLLLRQVVAAA
jgi:hypothetical protein